MPAERALRLRITGRVQGVGFRFETCNQARQLGLRGWVRNRHDGGVEVQIAGDAAACDTLVDWARRGPPGARVDALELTELSDDVALSIGSGFEQAATV
jgi:acylphosphatase